MKLFHDLYVLVGGTAVFLVLWYLAELPTTLVRRRAKRRATRNS